MIPRIVHFHWDGPPINWLRMISLHTFIKLNPRWEVRLVRTPEFIREKALPLYAHEADWTWLDAIYQHGGFAMATDTVFVRPMPEEWLEADLCGCTNGSGNFYHCCFGARPGNPFIGECLEHCDAVYEAEKGAADYQSYGIKVLKHITTKNGGIDRMQEEMGFGFFDQPAEAITPIPWHNPPRCWKPEPLEVPDGCIGVTWFGGHPESKEKEWEVPHEHSDSAIVKLAYQMTL